MNDLDIRFKNFLLETFPDVEIDADLEKEYWEFWVNGYQAGAEDHY